MGAGTKAEPMPVFAETKVSREICMFQLMVLEIVIGDVKLTLQDMESTNCKLPSRLEQLQVQWRQQKSSVVTWALYFKCIGVSPSTFCSETAWIADCVSRATAKGP